MLYTQPLNDVVKALVYAIAVSYHARLSRREKFEEQIVKYFESPCDLQESDKGAKAERFRTEITRCVHYDLKCVCLYY